MADAICRTCVRSVHSPYRVYDERGKVLEGCVAEDHDGYLLPISESSYWHNRKEAKQIRKQTRDHIKSLGKPSKSL